jgi:hypothetical protein
VKKNSLFNFTIKYFGFLKSVPLLPQLFDSQLKLWSLLTNWSLLQAIDDIEAEILSWEGTHTTLHKYGGLQFNYKGLEIGHIHSNGILDIRFNRKIKQQLMNEGKISDHHIFIKSGWISFYMQGRADTGYALKLLRMAYIKICQL